MVYKPHVNAHDPSKWYLFRRRNDVLRILLALAEQGRLPATRNFEIIFCPRDCTVGGYHTPYNGMPVGPRGLKSTNASSVSFCWSHLKCKEGWHIQQADSNPIAALVPPNLVYFFSFLIQRIPVFTLVACLGSTNIPFPILSRRSKDDAEWENMISLMKSNREAYPWVDRKPKAIFRGDIYGRSCWNGSTGGKLVQQDTIMCGRPRLMSKALDKGLYMTALCSQISKAFTVIENLLSFWLAWYRCGITRCGVQLRTTVWAGSI